MRRGKSPLRFVCMVVLLGMVWASLGAVRAAEYEIPGDRKASEILPAEILTGPHYRIREVVITDGYMDRFTVDSDYGVFEVTGDIALRKLVREIYAITALQE